MTTPDSTDSSLQDSNILFSDRIKFRHQRWWVEKGNHPFKQLGGKLPGREFAEKMGCKVPDLYAVIDQIDDLPSFDELPARFVLKPTRGWSAKNVLLMNKGRNSLDGLLWSRQAIIDQIKADPASNAPGVKFMIEEYLTNWDGKPGAPYDYKYYMFGGEMAFLHVIERNSSTDISRNRHWFLRGAWQPITRRIVKTQIPQPTPPPIPNCIEELREVTERMGRELNMFMRIDMYATTRGAVFGEFTPQPHGGSGYTFWADAWLGSLWKGEEGVL